MKVSTLDHNVSIEFQSVGTHSTSTAMLIQYLYLLVPVGLTAAYLVAILSDVLTIDSVQNRNSFQRSRRVFLVLCSLVVATYLGRAIELLATKNPFEPVFVFTIEQILLQTTVLLTLLVFPGPATTSYLTMWISSLAAEVAIGCTQFADGPRPSKASLTLSVVNTTLFFLLSLTTALTRSGNQQDVYNPEREALLGNGDLRSETSNPAKDPDHHSLILDSDVLTLSDASDSDEGESIKARQRERYQQAGSLLAYLKPYKALLPHIIPIKNFRMQLYLILVALSALLQRVLNVAGPYLMGRIVDSLTRTHRFPAFEVILYVLVTMISEDFCGLMGMNHALLNRLGAWSRQSLLVAAFDRILSLSAEFHDSKDSGEVIKAVEQAESVGNLFRLVVDELLPATLDLLIAMWFVSYILDIYATLIVIATGIAFYFATVVASRPLISSERVHAASQRTESEVVYESVGNWSTITYFNNKLHEIVRITKAATAVATAEVRSNDFSILMFASSELAERFGFVSLLLLAASRVARGTASVGAFVSMERYWSAISRPLYTLGANFRETTSYLVDAERLLQLFETEIKIQDHPNASDLLLTQGKIEFKDVHFSYEPSRQAICNLSLTVQPGQTVALVGATGSGKSTIIKLLLRLYDLDAGTVFIDNQDISLATLSSLRSHFGFVPQDTTLFNTTILENVRYGRLDASDDDVHAACVAARIHDRIISLPQGYPTRVGERGVKLSGGERQRVAIARVLLKNPSIVVLDEATSAMDSATEAEVQKALAKLTEGRTSVVVAHRLSTVMDADVIFVIDEGRVVEKGTHEALLRVEGGRYAELWEKQTLIHSAATTKARPIVDEEDDEG